MKELQTVALARLTNLEFGQHVKSICKGIGLLGNLGDVNLKNYLEQTNDHIIDYDKAMLQVQKSDETAKIVAADTIRDNAVSALTRYLKVFELSEIEAEVLAYQSLNTLLKTYKGIQAWNFEEESNGIYNLVTDLNNAKYLPSVTLLKMNDYVSRITRTNDAFKTVFAGRTQETALKEVFDVKKLRANLKNTYTDLCNYVLSMAKTINNEEFNKSLEVINAVRKYYADLLAKRKSASKSEALELIPPMS
jgi:Family of unknown function (DUF6261)